MRALTLVLVAACSLDTGDVRTPPGAAEPQVDAAPEADGSRERPYVIDGTDNVINYAGSGASEARTHFQFSVDADVRMTLDVRGPNVTIQTADEASVATTDSRVTRENLPPGTYTVVAESGDFAFDLHTHPYTDGTPEAPIVLANGPVPSRWMYLETNDTTLAKSSAIDTYPPFDTNESGSEILYKITLDQPMRLFAEILAPEPDGVDIDIHLLDSLAPVNALSRSDNWVGQTLQPGTYWLALDTYAGDHNAGAYQLMIQAFPESIEETPLFNAYVLEAVEWLDGRYGRLGYDSAAFTHDIAYGDYGDIPRSGGARTMCVAAVTEVILTAMQLYAKDTGDDSIFDHLPRSSWEGWGQDDIKAHLWVSYELETAGSADALRHFGMGMNVPFEQLTPGSFIGFNRTSGSGHATVFLSFIDIEGTEYDTWNPDVIGFKYYSAQGGYETGGLDYRYAVFDEFGRPEMPYKRDTGIIYTERQDWLNTGVLFAPSTWRDTMYADASLYRTIERPLAAFDPIYFDPITLDD